MKSGSLKFLALLLLLVLVSAAAFYFGLPEKRSPATLLFALKFYLWSAFLAAALWGLGRVVRSRFLALEIGYVDLALGFGCFAFVLAFYLKLTLNPYPPLLLLAAGFIVALKALLSARSTLKEFFLTPGAFLALLVLVVCTVSLSFNPSSNGFLYFPADFDSDLFHLAFPGQAVLKGHYLIPYWLRVPWHPQLTHHWYMFILSLLDITYIKSINVVVWVQIAVLFMTLGRTLGMPAAALALALLTAVPEFYRNITNTSLDAVMALFAVSSFVLFCRIIQNPRWRELVLLTVLCGFASGQKHFGLMFSAPLLALAALRLFQSEFWGTADRAFSAKGFFKFSGKGFGLIALCTLLFVPFYAQNIYSGNSLFFPFSGDGVNTFGWDEADLKEMLTHTIPKWGHSKSLAGFFSLPLHFLKYPADFQFYYQGSYYDFATSAVLALLFAALPIALCVRPWRKASYLLPLVVLLLDFVLWYRGSQVIRYLFPPLICGFYLLIHFLVPLWPAGSRAARLLGFILGGLALWQAAVPLLKPKLPLAVTKNEREDWLKTYITPRASAYQYLRGHLHPGEKVMGIISIDGLASFPEVVVCGDWFAVCRFNKFADLQLKFKDWPELVKQVRAHNFSHIIVQWNFFGPKLRPQPNSDFEGSFPPSTAACLEHVFFDGETTDVFRIKQECR